MKRILFLLVVCVSFGFSSKLKLDSFDTVVLGGDNTITRFDDNDKKVTCYILKPVALHYNTTCDIDKYNGAKKNCNNAYDGNNVGSISCVKM